MKNLLKLALSICLGAFAASCAREIVDLTGDIKGTVKDYDSEQILRDCRVVLSPGGKSTATDAAGAFGFEDLEAGTYTLTFTKSGYSDQTQEVSVTAGQTSRVYTYLKKLLPTTGSISGTVKDYANGQTISNCSVSISPGGTAKVSSSAGIYEFPDLTPGSYTLTFSKAGYVDAQTSVTVTAGNVTTSDMLLKSKSSFALSEDSYDFGDLEISKVIYFFNNSDEYCSFNISNIPYWITFSQTTGTVTAEGNLAVTATVDRDKVEEGEYNQNITISFSGKSSGAVNLFVKMKKVVLTTPSVSIAGSAENIKQNGFDINGSITSTGGSQIIGYGHCWNTTGNPTIYDSKTDLGVTNAIGAFKSTATNLSTYTTYYVRAYARNAQGVSYSEQVAVTTQDVGIDKWDGNIATSFAGGSGTIISPYIIMTGGQLLLAKKYSDKYFELGGNIDLNNKNWLPFEFSGNLDGKGYTIFNLYINNRPDNCQGLFSKCTGYVSNLTISNVSINAGSANSIGAISGYGGTITNCKVILNGTSSIVGGAYVGGIVGRSYYNATIQNCSVESNSSKVVIMGSGNVGGILGEGSSTNISDSHVSCKINGGQYVGGIVGDVNENVLTIQNCSFEGSLTGNYYVGGIAGYFKGTIKGCKVNADITASKCYAGGIAGYATHYGGKYPDIYGSYATGNLSSGDTCYGLSNYATIYLSYSAMTCTSSSYYGIGYQASGRDCAATTSNYSASGTNFMTNCLDITTFLRECYSDYADYWNFNNTWTWTGIVNGKEVQVSCPKLAWEK